MTGKASPAHCVRERLAGYWKLEVANALIVPLIVVALCSFAGAGAGWLTWLALVPVSALLLVGGLYWRGKLLALEGDKRALHKSLQLADRVQSLLLVLSLLAAALFVSALFAELPNVTNTDRWAAGVSGFLALLEYVNYYHRQLQHFDNRADFLRLLKGRGMRPAKMAVDLAAWRSD